MKAKSHGKRKQRNGIASSLPPIQIGEFKPKAKAMGTEQEQEQEQEQEEAMARVTPQPLLPGGAEDYVRDSINISLGLPASDRSLRLKLLATEDQCRRLQGHVFSLEDDLRAANRRIEGLKAEAAMNAAGVRRCVEEKEALTAAYNELSTKSAKECALYERDLERSMDACDDLARENDELRERLQLQQDANLEALTAQVQDLQKHNETLKTNLERAEAEVEKLCDDNRVLDEENKLLLRRLEKERLRRSERKQHSASTTSTKKKRKSSSLKDGISPAGRAIDFSHVGAAESPSRHPLSPLPHNSPDPDHRAHKK